MKPLKPQPGVASVENLEDKVDAALRRLVETNLVAVLFTDLAGNILNADDSFLKLLGYTSENLPRSIHDLTPPEHHRLDEEAFEKLMAFGACAPFEKDFLKHDGTQVPVLFGAALHEEEIACFVVDLSQNKQTQEKLNHLAYHDALTDLPNQVLFKDRLKQAIALSRRNDQMQAVLLLNLDRFKTINDSLGYTAGDRLLQSVAQRLTSCVRESDTVARFGGDEFAILLTQIPRAQDAANAARAIKQSLDQAFLFEDQEIFVSSSIGISLYPQDGRDTAGLLKTAGVALDRAKVQGGNNYQFYTAGGTTRALKQLVLESNLRSGLDKMRIHRSVPAAGRRSWFSSRGHGSARALATSESRIALSERVCAAGGRQWADHCARRLDYAHGVCTKQSVAGQGLDADVSVSEFFGAPVSAADIHHGRCTNTERHEPRSALARTRADRELDHEGSGGGD